MKRRKQHITQEQPVEPLYVLPQAIDLVRVEALAMASVAAVAEYPADVTRDREELDMKMRSNLAIWREKQANARRPLTNDFYAFCEAYVPLYCEKYEVLVHAYDTSHEKYLADRSMYDSHTPLECLVVMRVYFAEQLQKERNQRA